MKRALKYFFLALITFLPILSVLQFYFGYESTINFIAVVTDSVSKTDNLRRFLSERKIGYLHFLALILFIFSSICFLKVNWLYYHSVEICSGIQKDNDLSITVGTEMANIQLASSQIVANCIFSKLLKILNIRNRHTVAKEIIVAKTPSIIELNSKTFTLKKVT